MIAFDRHAVSGLHTILETVPIEIATVDQLGDLLFALEDHAELGFFLGQIDGPVEQRFVMDHAPRLHPAGGGDDAFRRSQSSIRTASSFAAKPPKTTEWMAPIRAHRPASPQALRAPSAYR